MLNDGDSYQASVVIQAAAQTVCAEHCRPSILLHPKVYPDDNMWCALYGDDLQMGIAGFGKTPCEAMLDFDQNYYNQRLKAKEAVSC